MLDLPTYPFFRTAFFLVSQSKMKKKLTDRRASQAVWILLLQQENTGKILSRHKLKHPAYSLQYKAEIKKKGNRKMTYEKINRKPQEQNTGNQKENKADSIRNEKEKEAIARMLKAAKDAAYGIGEYYTYEEIFEEKNDEQKKT